MKYPKKLEITIENDAQLAILYSCFNVCADNVIKTMSTSFNEKIQKMTTYFEATTNKSSATKYIGYCWRKVNDMISDKATTPKFGGLLAALEKSGITKEIINKKKSKDNIAKILVEVNDIKKSVKILEFKNIKTRSELPIKYFENYPQFYLTVENNLKFKYLDSKNNVIVHTFCVGDYSNITEFRYFLGKMKEAGKRLTQINREEKQLSTSIVATKEFSI